MHISAIVFILRAIPPLPTRKCAEVMFLFERFHSYFATPEHWETIFMYTKTAVHCSQLRCHFMTIHFCRCQNTLIQRVPKTSLGMPGGQRRHWDATMCEGQIQGLLCVAMYKITMLTQGLSCRGTSHRWLAAASFLHDCCICCRNALLMVGWQRHLDWLVEHFALDAEVWVSLLRLLQKGFAIGHKKIWETFDLLVEHFSLNCSCEPHR